VEFFYLPGINTCPGLMTGSITGLIGSNTNPHFRQSTGGIGGNSTGVGI
jgi:hypothetical protein